MAAAMGFPMGMRFRPTDVEKMNFLLCKVSGLALPCGDLMIGTADLYGEKEPWQILRDSEEEGELCLFTTLKKIGKNNKRYSRNVGNGGTWANKGQRAPIYGGRQLMGYKRCFRYENKRVDDHDNDVGTWLLKEYTLPDHVNVKQEYKDYALCVLKRKEGKTTPSLSPSPPHVEPQEEENIVFDSDYFMSLLLGSGSEQSTIPSADQEESNDCGLREFAEQFLREHNPQQFDDGYPISSYY